MNAQTLFETIEGLPNISGSEDLVAQAMARSGPFYLPQSGIDFGRIRRASSRCDEAVAVLLNVVGSQAAATASRHVFIAAVRSARCVRAETTWRWVLKVL